MKMNKKQRVIIWIGIILVGLLGIFPPWSHTFKNHSTYSEESAGYSFIASPPQKKLNNVLYGVKIDSSRFLLQLLTVCLVFGFAVFVSGEKTEKQ